MTESHLTAPLTKKQGPMAANYWASVHSLRVMPCNLETKEPCVPKGSFGKAHHGFTVHPMDFSADQGVAVLTGYQSEDRDRFLCVFDLDGAMTYDDLLDTYGLRAHGLPTETLTTKGGRHLYFWVPVADGIGPQTVRQWVNALKTDKDTEGALDLKWDGGYAIEPYAPDNAEVPIATVPVAVLKAIAIRYQGRPAYEQDLADLSKGIDDEYPAAGTLTLTETQLADLVQVADAEWPEGQGHDAAYALACVCRKSGVAQAQAETLVSEAADAHRPPSRTQDTLNQVREAYEAEPRFGWPKATALLPQTAAALTKLTQAQQAATLEGFEDLFTVPQEPKRIINSWGFDDMPDCKGPEDLQNQFGDVDHDALAAHRMDWLNWFNARFTVLVAHGGRVAIVSYKPSPLANQANAMELCFHKPNDFVANAFSNYKSCLKVKKLEKRLGPEGQSEELQFVNVAQWWFEHSKRAKAVSLTFCPETDEPMVNGHLNVWTGFGVVPQPAGPELEAWLNLAKEVIVSQDDGHWDFFLNWAAWVVQNRGNPSGVCVVVRGDQGTGKNSVLNPLVDMFGAHGITLSQPSQLSGKFNAALEHRCIVLANESFAVADKQVQNALKGIITESKVVIERKGIDPIEVRNAANLMMASNNDWVVPAGEGERRYAVFQGSSKYVGKWDFWKAFNALDKQAMTAQVLQYLLTRELPAGWHPTNHVPKTQALREQIQHGFRGAERIVYQVLVSGDLGAGYAGCDSEGQVYVSPQWLAEETRGKANSMSLDKEFKKCFVDPGSVVKVRKSFKPLQGKGGGRTMTLCLPPLEMARAAWAHHHGLDEATWPTDDDGEWTTQEEGF